MNSDSDVFGQGFEDQFPTYQNNSSVFPQIFRIKLVRNIESKFFSHRYLIEFNETNRMRHVPHLYDIVILLK